jgi:hypothetical protein
MCDVILKIILNYRKKKIVIKMSRLVNFTGVPVDIVYDTLAELRVNDVKHLCNTHEVLNYICSDEQFWYNYLNKNYPPHDYGFTSWQIGSREHPKLPNFISLAKFLESGKSIRIYDPLGTYSDRIYLNDTYESLYKKYAGDIYNPVPGGIFPAVELFTADRQPIVAVDFINGSLSITPTTLSSDMQLFKIINPETGNSVFEDLETITVV